MIEKRFLRQNVLNKLDFVAASGPHREEEQQSDRNVSPDFPQLSVLHGPSSPALDQQKANPGVRGGAWV